MYAGCAGKTVRSLENACHTWAPWRCDHEKALYKSTFTLPLVNRIPAQMGCWDNSSQTSIYTGAYDDDTYFAFAVDAEAGSLISTKWNGKDFRVCVTPLCYAAVRAHICSHTVRDTILSYVVAVFSNNYNNNNTQDYADGDVIHSMSSSGWSNECRTPSSCGPTNKADRLGSESACRLLLPTPTITTQPHSTISVSFASVDAMD